MPAKAAPVDLRVYDRLAEAAGLSFIARYATWDEQPFVAGGTYAVSVHRRARAARSPSRAWTRWDSVLL